MNPKHTWLMVALAVLLGAYVYLFERPEPPATEGQLTQVLLLPQISKDAAHTVELKISDTTIRVASDQGHWRIVEPIDYPASETKVEGLLRFLESLEFRTEVTAEEIAAQGGLQEFGLEPPKARILVEQDTGTTELLIGDSEPAGNLTFVRVADRESIYSVDGVISNLAKVTADDWRDPRVLALQDVEIDRLEIRSENQYMIVKKDLETQRWFFEQPIRGLRAAGHFLGELLQLIREAQVSKFVAMNSDNGLSDFGLEPARMEAEFGAGEGKSAVLQFGHPVPDDPESVYARFVDQDVVVVLPIDLWNNLSRPIEVFREPFLLESGFVFNRIVVSADEAFTLRQQTNQTWRVEAPFDFPADTELLGRFLLGIAELQIVDYVNDKVSDFAPYGLDASDRFIGFQLARTNTAGAPEMVNVLQVDFGTNIIDRILVKRGDEDSVYAVPAGDVRRLASRPFQLRDRQIWSFSTNQVDRVTVTQGDLGRTMTRNSRGQWSITGLSGMSSFKIDGDSFNETINELSQLRANEWTAVGRERLATFGFTDPPQHRLEIHVRQEEEERLLRLEIGKTSPGGSPYAWVDLDGLPTVFELPHKVSLYILQYLNLRLTAP